MIVQRDLTPDQVFDDAVSVIAEAGSDPKAIASALRDAGYLATIQERGGVCEYEDCHKDDGDIPHPCYWGNVEEGVIMYNHDRPFTRFVSHWEEEAVEG